MDPNLVIVDEYVQCVGRLCENRGKLLDIKLSDYVKILEEIKSDAIIHGEISKELVAFTDCVKSLQGQLSTLSEKVELLCNAFIADVDSSDEYLF